MKKKIKLTDLKVQSFVTALSEDEKRMARGGDLFDVISEMQDSISICKNQGAVSICKMGTICTPLANTFIGSCVVYCKGKD